MGRIETETAFLEQTGSDTVIWRFKPGAMVNIHALRENLKVRQQFPGAGVDVIIGIFPEDVDFKMSLLDQDLYSGRTDLEQGIRLMAIVAEGVLFETVAKLYFSYHPPYFTHGVFTTEAAAFAWVEECNGTRC